MAGECDEAAFDAIRPFNRGEMRQALDSLLNDRQFQHILRGYAPWLPTWLRNGLLRMAFIGLREPQDFQLRFMKPVVNRIIRKCTDGVSFGHDDIQRGQARYTFISNHRDIVLDSAFLDIMLNNAGFERTVEIGIGDNLLIYPWIKTLVRLNKAFIVRRGLSPRELLMSSQLMSRYMHHAINNKKENIWIAQREGRAKDSNDRTQDSILKMMCMGGEGSIVERLKHLHLVPLSLSYEYDPCDYLKAMEYQLKRDVPGWRKSKKDDLDNMKTGIFGRKGRVHFQASPCIDTWLDTQPADMPKTEIFTQIAKHIDEEIHRSYHLYPGNYIAMDELQGTHTEGKYTDADIQTFNAYIDSQLQKIDIPNPDWHYLRERMLTMYANPAINAIASKNTGTNT